MTDHFWPMQDMLPTLLFLESSGSSKYWSETALVGTRDRKEGKRSRKPGVGAYCGDWPHELNCSDRDASCALDSLFIILHRKSTVCSTSQYSEHATRDSSRGVVLANDEHR